MEESISRPGIRTIRVLRRRFHPSQNISSPESFISLQAPSLLNSPLGWLKEKLIPHTKEEQAGLERANWFLTEGRGYSTEQSTQPQTLGYSLADSPVGLLAWIYEKLVVWSDSYPWEDDEGRSKSRGPSEGLTSSFSFDLGLDLPVLHCGTSGVDSHLLRTKTRKAQECIPNNSSRTLVLSL